MKLNKLRPSELYQWWVVSSLALQAHAAAVQARLQTPANSSPAADASGGSNGTSSGNSSSSSGQAPPPSAAAALGADKLLALAEAMAGRLLSKAPAQGGHHSWESVMLYLGLLQAQVRGDQGCFCQARAGAMNLCSCCQIYNCWVVIATQHGATAGQVAVS